MLFTNQNEGTTAAHNAELVNVSKKEMQQLLSAAQAHSDAWNDGAICKIDSIDEWGDAWVVLHHQPKMSRSGYTTIGGVRCTVQKPGTHPGGKAWWCTPVQPVYCIV